ncbi:hypothetical protein ACHAXA_009887 [Cyclostephanos tholiformis]|uniref:Uncharacterized protein n=1 Tax=Cyclostephanos tholiformis TaxID=382380 RepID=A0ABD3RW65_9STRA
MLPLPSNVLGVMFAFAISGVVFVVSSSIISTTRHDDDPRRHHGRRDLQESIACLASGTSDFYSCCPNYASGYDPSDGVCTLLSCLELGDDLLSLRSICACDAISSGCELVMPYSSVVPELPDMCIAVSSCCANSTTSSSSSSSSAAEGGGNENGAWDECMTNLRDAGNYTLPDFSTLIPGGIPVITADDVASTSTAIPPTGDDVATTTTVVAASAFEPPPSVTCLAAGIISGGGGSDSTFLDCCPGPDPNDGLCTMLWCVDATDPSAVNGGCACDMIESACEQIRGFESMLTNLAEVCDAVADCCMDDGTTDNEKYGTCMKDKGLTFPDLESLVPGGLPEDMVMDDSTMAGTDSTALPGSEEEEEDEEGATTIMTTTTVPPATAETTPATSGGGPIPGYFAIAALAVVLPSLAIVMA